MFHLSACFSRPGPSSSLLLSSFFVALHFPPAAHPQPRTRQPLIHTPLVRFSVNGWDRPPPRRKPSFPRFPFLRLDSPPPPPSHPHPLPPAPPHHRRRRRDRRVVMYRNMNPGDAKDDLYPVSVLGEGGFGTVFSRLRFVPVSTAISHTARRTASGFYLAAL